MAPLRSTLLGTLTSCALAASLAFPCAGQTFPAQRLYVASVTGDAVHELDAAGAIVRTLGEGVLEGARGVAFGPDGALYVSEAERVVVLDGAGELVREIGPGSALATPRGLAFGAKGRLYVASGDRVLVFSTDGDALGAIGAGSGLAVAAGVAVSSAGHVLVSSGGTNAVLEFDPAGALVRTIGAGTGLAIPTGIAFGPEGRLYVCSLFDNKIHSFEADGSPSPGGNTWTVPGLAFPSGIAVGPSGNFFVSSLATQAIFEVGPTGILVGAHQPAGLGSPEGLAFPPRRFAVKLTGTLTVPDAKPKKVKESGVLSLAPGSRTVQLTLADRGTTFDVVSTFALDTLVGHGAEAHGSFTSGTRLITGTDLGAPAVDETVAQFALTVKGGMPAFWNAPAFLPKSASGGVHLSAPGAVFRGTLKTKKPLN